ncbi:MAG: hypothetical protein EOM53_05255 [Alphaproteobacteria bacterium]|nr:hypothetical protein [Alphaproteobacteria bacterium]
MDIKKIEENLKEVNSNRITSFFALKTVINSNIALEKFNKTPEAHTFLLIKNSLWIRCIVELRKVLEPKGKVKTVNLQFLVNQVSENEDFFAKKHYEDYLKVPETYIRVTNGEDTLLPVESFQKQREERAKDAEEKCRNDIHLLKKRWKCMWDLLGKKPSFSFLKDERDNLVHSLDEKGIKYYSIYKVGKLLNITKWFIKKLDFIVFNKDIPLMFSEKNLDDLSKSFWTKCNRE